MLDIGWTELLVVGLVLILVVGPKDLPKVIRTMGQWTARARRVAREFQESLDDIARDSEIEEMRKQFNDPGGIKGQVENAIDPGGALRETVSTDYADNQVDSNESLLEEIDKKAKTSTGAVLEKEGDAKERSDTPSEGDFSTALKADSENEVEKNSSVDSTKRQNQKSQ